MDTRLSRPRKCQCGSCDKQPLDKEPFCEYHLKNGCPIVSPLSGWEPTYRPEEYTTDKSLQHSHNCLAYALGIKDPERIKSCREKNDCRFHKLGKKSGHSDSFSGNLTCPVILSRTMSDVGSAIPIDFTSKCPAGTSKIAVVTDEIQDMHYYRQGSSGFWDHKPGGREPTELDSEGAKIWNPERASRYYPREHKEDTALDYRNFCGYLCVPRTRVNTLKAGGRRQQQKRKKRVSLRRKTKKARSSKRTNRA